MAEQVVSLQTETEIWEAVIDPDLTVFIRIHEKANPENVREQFCRCKSEFEATEWLDDQKQRAMRRGFYYKLAPQTLPPPPVSVKESTVTALVQPQPKEPEPRAPQGPLKRKVRI
jgi:hypothetical protein